MVGSVTPTALAISEQDFFCLDNWLTMKIDTPAIVAGCLPVAICNFVMFWAVVFDALVMSIGIDILLHACSAIWCAYNTTIVPGKISLIFL